MERRGPWRGLTGPSTIQHKSPADYHQLPLALSAARDSVEQLCGRTHRLINDIHPPTILTILYYQIPTKQPVH